MENTVAPMILTEADVASSNQLPANWYKLKLVDVTSGPGTSDPNSITWTCKYVVTTEGPFKNTPLVDWPNSKNMGKASAMLRAFTKNIAPGTAFNQADLKDRECIAQCAYDAKGDFRGNKILAFKEATA